MYIHELSSPIVRHVPAFGAAPIPAPRPLNTAWARSRIGFPGLEKPLHKEGLAHDQGSDCTTTWASPAMNSVWPSGVTAMRIIPRFSGEPVRVSTAVSGKTPATGVAVKS
jgi:hypothetical protein